MASPSKPSNPPDLVGLSASLAGLPKGNPKGGTESGFSGETGGSSPAAPTQQKGEFAGLGPLLENADRDVFKTVDELVRRQEPLALNHLAQDIHYSLFKLGYPWSVLKHDTKRDIYTQSMPYGSQAISIQAVPNKMWDLVNKTTESLLVDFPSASCEPGSDSEEAQATCDMGNRYLDQEAGEQGTNDAVHVNDRVSKALVTATSYSEVWTDPMGGGYVPLQIKAHPHSEDPDNPLVDPDGQPTTDYVLRYVTAPTGGQFTEDPSEAAPQWQPKIRATKWGREHVRVFPENAPIADAEKVIILGHCSLSEAKRRWPNVAALEQSELSKLLDWTPQRYLVLLPPFQRARWKVSDGKEKEKAGSSDERIMFYYHAFIRPCADYPKGADVVVTGASINNVPDGWIVSKSMLAKPVPMSKQPPPPPVMPGMPPVPPKKLFEIRCMEIPVQDWTPCGDPDEGDPSGRCFVERFAGAVESNASLASSFASILDQILHPDKYLPSTSPIEGWEIENARATGDFLTLTRAEDQPFYGPQPALPAAFFQFYELSDEAINSMASSERAASGADNSKERSGKALQIAINRNNVSLSGMQTSVNNSYARFCRLKIERAMSDFTTSQMIGYVGEDGAYKQDEWTGTDFALIGKVTIKSGTGTMMPPDQKVQYISNLVQGTLLPQDEAMDAARPAFSKTLGLPPDPHQQRIERQVASWLKGPPSPEWIQQYQLYTQQQQEYQAAEAQYQQDAVAYQNNEAMRMQNEQAAGQQRLQDESKQKDHAAKSESENAQHQRALEMENVKHDLSIRAKQHEQQNTPPPVTHQEPAPREKGGDIHIHIAGKKATVIRKNPDGSMIAESMPDEAA